MTDKYAQGITNQKIHCSFCKKSSKDVCRLIAGPSVYICDQCIKLCYKMLNEQIENKNKKDFHLSLPKPREINSYLDTHVIGQKYAKKVLSVAIYNHYKRLQENQLIDSSSIPLKKNNILLIGPPGSGKTLLAESLARYLNIPFVIVDATVLTEAGYVGEDVENIIQRLLQKCDFDLKKTEKGIIYIDEIDKITRKSSGPSITRDVSGEGVQQALLKIIEGTIASVHPAGKRKHPQQELVQVNTSNILFICGGSFNGLRDIVSNRMEKSTSIGFNAILKNKNSIDGTENILLQVEPEDLIKFGLIPEFVGRLPVITALDILDEEALIKILTQPKNALVKQYQDFFKAEGVDLEFCQKSLGAIAKKAIIKNIGARGLSSIIEKILLDTMYELPSKKGIKKVLVNESVVLEKSKPILTYL